MHCPQSLVCCLLLKCLHCSPLLLLLLLLAGHI
jgi:hypothetical protein